jgi:hypothetical protein
MDSNSAIAAHADHRLLTTQFYDRTCRPRIMQSSEECQEMVKFTIL